LFYGTQNRKGFGAIKIYDNKSGFFYIPDMKKVVNFLRNWPTPVNLTYVKLTKNGFLFFSPLVRGE
jgi:hypothetical protein